MSNFLGQLAGARNNVRKEQRALRFQDMLMQQKDEDRALDSEYRQAQITRMQTPKEPAQARRDPVADHAANRRFDIANPLPRTGQGRDSEGRAQTTRARQYQHAINGLKRSHISKHNTAQRAGQGEYGASGLKAAQGRIKAVQDEYYAARNDLATEYSDVGGETDLNTAIRNFDNKRQAPATQKGGKKGGIVLPPGAGNADISTPLSLADQAKAHAAVDPLYATFLRQKIGKAK